MIYTLLKIVTLPQLFIAFGSILSVLLRAFFPNTRPYKLVLFIIITSFLIACTTLHDYSFSNKNSIVVLAFYMYSLFIWYDTKSLKSFDSSVLFLFSVLGALTAIESDNLLTIFIGLEIQALSVYAISAIFSDNKDSSEASIKYFIMGIISSSLMLFGISLIYGFNDGNLSLLNLVGNSGVYAGITFVIYSMLLKLGAAPFHFWLLDVYGNVNSLPVSFFATANKFASFIIMLNMLNMIGGGDDLFLPEQQHFPLNMVFIPVAIASIVIGNIGALTQNNIRKLLAYSSVAHTGYILCGVISGNLLSSGIYLIYYTLSTLGIFSIVNSLDLSSISSLNKGKKRFSLVLSMLFFSMVGIPPFPSFTAKIGILISLLDAGHEFLFFVFAAGTMLSICYCIKVVKSVYFGDVQESCHYSSSKMTLPIIFLSLGIVGFVGFISFIVIFESLFK